MSKRNTSKKISCICDVTLFGCPSQDGGICATRASWGGTYGIHLELTREQVEAVLFQLGLFCDRIDYNVAGKRMDIGSDVADMIEEQTGIER